MDLLEQGVSSDRVERLLRYHAPGQIDMGFQKLARYSPDEIADVVLKGRFGYRKGYRRKLAPPKATAAPNLGGTPSDHPAPSREQEQEALQRYLNDGMLPH